MLRPRWSKVLRDLWGNKTRTILVVLSIAVGVFAVGLIATARTNLSVGLAESYAAIDPASAMLMVSDPFLGGGTVGFDDDLVHAVRRMDTVAEAEGRRMVTVRLRIGPNEWRNLQLFAISDYEDMNVNRLLPQSGQWPPGDNEMLIERSALGLAQADVGDRVLIKTPLGDERHISIVGLAHDLSRLPPFMDGNIYGYITLDTLEWLGEPREFNEMHIIVADHADDKAHVVAVSEQVRDKIERSGRPVSFISVPDPGKHPLDNMIQTLIFLLGILGILAMFLSGFLVVTTISALLAQHVRQIGILKAIGMRSNQVMIMYFVLVVAFGLLALLLAVPLGMIGAQGFSEAMAGQFNFDLTTSGTPPTVFAMQAAVSLLIPVLAALYPILKGTRISVREALDDTGIGTYKGASNTARSLPGRLIQGSFAAISHWFAMLGGRPLVLSLRNTFRRKGRLALTLITLTLSGSIFVSVFTVRDSLFKTLDDLLNTYQYDLWITFNQPYRIEQLVELTRDRPGVTAVEGMGATTVRRVRPDDTESDGIFVFGSKAGSTMFTPVIVRGRWLLPEDENAIVLTTEVMRNEPDIDVGSQITLKMEGRDTNWTVVGVAQFIVPFAFVNHEHYAHMMRESGRANTLIITTSRHDAAFQTEVASELETYYERLGLPVSSIVKIAEERAEVAVTFNIVVALLASMAVLLAFVGGLGLMGTMSINVLERTREIGIMRAIGASNGTVMQLVIVEGIIIGMVSWLLSVLLAYPLSRFLCDAVGFIFLQDSLYYIFSMAGAVIWLGVVIVLSSLASVLPAWNASRLTVRDVLAYE
ncbi:MAG: ABC transporter permease [Chloroflexaceae bacterium]|nr:ABC transporter permease [Chloroflexaceae bacterium]